MRKTKLLLVAFLAMLGLGAHADEYEVDQKLTSVDELDGKLFAIVNEDEGKAFCCGVSNDQDMRYLDYADALAAKSCLLKLEPAQGDDVTGYYYFRTYTLTGEHYNPWGWGGYFNSQPETGTVCFSLGLNNQNGQDIKNGAVWALEVSEGKIAFKNIGTGKYLKDDAPAKYDTPTYFTLYTMKETEASKIARLTPAYNNVKKDAQFFGVAAATITEQDAAVASATAGAQVEAAIQALQDAIDAIIPTLNFYDVTSFTIKNPKAQNKTNWEGDDFGGQSDNVCEYWNKSGAGFHQTLEALPVGKYRLTVVALQRTNMIGTVYAGGNSTTIAQVSNSIVNQRYQANDWFNEGNGRNYVYFEVTGAPADITIGLTADNTTSDHWTVWQSFSLETLDEGVAISYLAPGFTTLVSEAEATRDDAKYANVTGIEKTNLQAAIDATPSTVDEYETAVKALNTASDAFKAAATSYNAYVTYKNETIALWGSDLGVAAPTTAAEAVAAVATLNIAQYDKVASDYTFSLNGLIGDFGSWIPTATVAGEDAEPNYLDWEHWSGQQHAYYEQASTGWGNEKGWTIKYEKTCKLPKGKYVLKVAARSSAGTTSKVSCDAIATTIALPSAGNNTRGINTSGAASWRDGDKFANTGDFHDHPATVGGSGTGWQWRFLPFEVTGDGKTEVTMTFYAEANSKYQWMSISDGELLCTEDVTDKVNFDERKNNLVQDYDIANVTIFRTIKKGYNTIVLPFTLGANQITNVFGEGVEVYNYSENSSDPEKVTVNFKKGDGSIKANVPVLIKAPEDKTSLEFKGVKVEAPKGTIQVEGTNIDFIGSYKKIGTIAEGNYFINDGKLYKSNGNTSMKSFRAYLKPKADADVRVDLYIDGIATGIEAINADMPKSSDNAIYNLNGQRVQKAQRGLYIMDGKKVLVK